MPTDRESFIRFVVRATDEDSLRLKGLFQACYDLRNQGQLADYEKTWFKETVRWFDKHLDAPARLSRSRRSGAHENAISWFRATASDHIAKIRELAALLEHHGVSTHMIQTERPGYVVHEDEFQIAAIPFKDTPA